jgi:histidinol-phosphate aminotransferase
MTAYAVPSAQGLIKLDAMENPYRLPEDAARRTRPPAGRRWR